MITILEVIASAQLYLVSGLLKWTGHAHVWSPLKHMFVVVCMLAPLFAYRLLSSLEFNVFGYCSEACVWYICKCRKHYGRRMKLLVQKTRISILHLMDFWVDTFLLKDAFPAQQPRTCQYCLWKVLFCGHIGKLFIGLLNNSGRGLLQIQGLFGSWEVSHIQWRIRNFPHSFTYR